MFDYIHLFNYAGAYFSFNDGRQLNFIDYSQHYTNFNNILLIDFNDKHHFQKYHGKFFDENYIRNIDFSIYKFKSINYFNENLSNKTLLCDFLTLAILINNNIPIEKYKNIYVFDCYELTVFFRDLPRPNTLDNYKSVFQNKQKILDKLNTLNVTFLVTHYNVKDVKNFNYKIFYKKINFDLFKNNLFDDRKNELVYYYSSNNKNINHLLEKINNKYNITFTTNYHDIFSYQTILYTQKPYVGYIEQFGRMIFELREFGYDVIIDNMFKQEEKTGLDYYLDYYKDKSINIKNDKLYERIDL